MIAVLVATAPAEDGSPAALLSVDATPAVSRLAVHLRDNGAEQVHVLTRPEWREAVIAALPTDVAVTVEPVGSTADTLDAIATIAAADDTPLLLGEADIITQREVLAGLLRDPRVASGILASTRNPQNAPLLRVRIDRGRVTAAESAFHEVHKPNAFFLGLLKVAGGERERTATVARHLAELTREELPPLWEEELAEKVQAWGRAFFARHGATAALAEQLERAVGTAKWLPEPERIRSELDERFRLDVLHAASVASEDVIALLLTGLCRDGAALTAGYLRDLFWARPFSAERAAATSATMATIDEDRALLNSAVKASDGFFTTFFVSPYSKYIARWCAHRGFTPNQVTVVSMLLGAVAAGAFAMGTSIGLIVGAVVLQVAFTADCVDGQLARYSRQFSKLGAWLDSVFDRGKEYLVFAGLALGATRTGDDGTVWLLAAAALALQTTRHAIDFSWGQGQQQSIAGSLAAPISSPQERADIAEAVAPEVQARRNGALASLGNVGLSASHFFEQRGWMKWAKRILVLPIGERFALISVTAAVWGPRTTFTALLAWGTFALMYSLTGRALRTVA